MSVSVRVCVSSVKHTNCERFQQLQTQYNDGRCFCSIDFLNIQEKGEELFFSFCQGKLVLLCGVRHLESNISLSSPISGFSLNKITLQTSTWQIDK